MEEDAAGKSACWPLATAQRGSRAEALVRYVEYCASPLLAGSDTPGALTHLLQILLAQRREIILSSNSNELVRRVLSVALPPTSGALCSAHEFEATAFSCERP